MDSNNKFWLVLWATIAVALVSMVGLIANTVITNHAVSAKVLTEATARGADPIKVRCAMYGVEAGDQAMCVIAAAK